MSLVEVSNMAAESSEDLAIFACVGGKVYAEDSYSDFRNDNNTHDNRLLSLY